MDASAGLKRAAFSIAVVALAGCGGSQPPLITPNAIAHSRSWMLPEVKNEDLLYISDGYHNQVYLYSFPKAKPVGTLVGVSGVMCPDKDGNVWFANPRADTIVKYAHGGTTPIATLKVPRGPKLSVFSCVVDPGSGNLAAGGSGPLL